MHPLLPFCIAFIIYKYTKNYIVLVLQRKHRGVVIVNWMGPAEFINFQRCVLELIIIFVHNLHKYFNLHVCPYKRKSTMQHELGVKIKPIIVLRKFYFTEFDIWFTKCTLNLGLRSVKIIWVINRGFSKSDVRGWVIIQVHFLGG